jgi:hypothetical protein
MYIVVETQRLSSAGRRDVAWISSRERGAEERGEEKGR